MRACLPSWLGVAVFAGLTTMCSPYVNRGSTLYWEGRYIEAAEVFERTQSRITKLSPRDRAQYGLYRGLTFLRLGDVPGARQWLAYAYAVERTQPGTLDGEERVLLDGAWGECEHHEPDPLLPASAEPLKRASALPSSQAPLQLEHGKRSMPPPARSSLVPR